MFQSHTCLRVLTQSNPLPSSFASIHFHTLYAPIPLKTYLKMYITITALNTIVYQIWCCHYPHFTKHIVQKIMQITRHQTTSFQCFATLFPPAFGWCSQSQSSLLICVQTGCSSDTLASSEQDASRSPVGVKQDYPMLLVNISSASRPAKHIMTLLMRQID